MSTKPLLQEIDIELISMDTNNSIFLQCNVEGTKANNMTLVSCVLPDQSSGHDDDDVPFWGLLEMEPEALTLHKNPYTEKEIMQKADAEELRIFPIQCGAKNWDHTSFIVPIYYTGTHYSYFTFDSNVACKFPDPPLPQLSLNGCSAVENAVFGVLTLAATGYGVFRLIKGVLNGNNPQYHSDAEPNREPLANEATSDAGRIGSMNETASDEAPQVAESNTLEDEPVGAFRERSIGHVLSQNSDHRLMSLYPPHTIEILRKLRNGDHTIFQMKTYKILGNDTIRVIDEFDYMATLEHILTLVETEGEPKGSYIYNHPKPRYYFIFYLEFQEDGYVIDIIPMLQ